MTHFHDFLVVIKGFENDFPGINAIWCFLATTTRWTVPSEFHIARFISSLGNTKRNRNRSQFHKHASYHEEEYVVNWFFIYVDIP